MKKFQNMGELISYMVGVNAPNELQTEAETKMQAVGINPLSWIKSLRDEILLRNVKGGGFNFI